MKSILRTLLFLMLLFSAAHPSWAEQGLSGNVTLGGDLTWLTKESYKYGEYDGLHEDSKHSIVDVELSHEKDSYYLELKGLDLGYHDETVVLEGGRYGKYSLQVGYTKLIHFISEGETPLLGKETDILTLPGGFGQHTTTSTMDGGAGIPSHDIDLDTKRKDDFIAYEQHLSEKASFLLSYRHGEKEGIRSFGGVAGVDGSLSASIILPERVDYVTDSFNAGVSYKAEKGTVKIDYNVSNFHNRYASLTWDNPFAAPSGDAYPDKGRSSLPPDNSSRSISIRATADVTEKVWLSFMAGYDHMEQDEALLPYTINTASTVPVSLPRSSAKARVDASHLVLDMVAVPTPSLSLNTRYSHYESDTKTPVDLFLKVPNDTGGQVAQSDTRALYSLPHDQRKDRIELDGLYRLAGGTKVSLGLDHEIISRPYRAVDGTKESTLKAAMSRRLPRQGRIKIDYSYAHRQIDGDYDGSSLYNAYHTAASGFYNYTAGIFDENEELRQFDIAERTRRRYAFRYSQMVFGHIVAGLSCRYTDDDYKKSELGLREREDRSCTLDLSANTGKETVIYTYYTYDRVDTNQANRSFTVAQKYSEAIDARRTWWLDNRDLNHTVGLGTTMGLLGGDLVIDALYLYVASRTALDFQVRQDSTIGSPLSLPDLRARRDAFNLSGQYRIDKKISLGAEYYFENFHCSDWATDGMEPVSAAIDEVLTMTGSFDDYEVHGIRFYLTYRL